MACDRQFNGAKPSCWEIKITVQQFFYRAPSNTRDLHVALINLAQNNWTAGGEYLKNVLLALQSLPELERPRISLVTPPGSPISDYALLISNLGQVIEVSNSSWDRYIKSLYLRIPLPGSLENILAPRSQLISALVKSKANVLFSNDEYGPKFPVPLVSWIPDFQQMHLYELFSRSKIRTRNRHNQRIAAYAQRVLLSSQSAFQDFASIAPSAVSKARIVHFVAQPPEDIYSLDPTEIYSQYHLPERFFYLPNQFWRHKNHQAVIDALSLLKDRHPEIVVACSGNTFEFRSPSYFRELMQKVQNQGLTERFIYLGIIPHAHLYQLMRQSLAVLQPSWFEGWSTTVEEAKSIGKGMILSDIPVHREQDPPGSMFFDPGNPDALADCLVNVYSEKQPGPDFPMEENARQTLPLRTQEFGGAFLDILRQAASTSS